MRPGSVVSFLLVVLSAALPTHGAERDPAVEADIQEYLRQVNLGPRERAVESHGSVKKAAEIYAARLESTNPETRGAALGDLIALGLEEYLPPIQKVMREGDTTTFTAASLGIWSVLRESHASPTFRAGILDALIQSFERSIDANRVRLALQIDPTKPVPAILKPEVWRKDSAWLQDLLPIFQERRARVPIEKLRELAPQLPNGDDERAWSIYARFLDCYALVAPTEAEPLIIKALKDEPPRKSPAARTENLAKALCTARGVVDPYDVTLARGQRLGFGKLSKVERTYMALMFFYLAGEMGGFTQFFESPAIELWTDLRAGLVEIKEDNYVKLLDAWLPLFQGMKPGEKGFQFESAEREFEKRTGKGLTEEIDRISKAHQFEANLDRSIHLWAAEHAADFKAAWKSAK